MKKIISIITISILLSGCGLFQKSQVVVQKKDSIVYVEKIMYKEIVLPTDSTWLNAYLQCDSNGIVLIDQVNYWNSKAMENQWSLENNTFKFKVVYKHDTIKIPYTNIVYKEIKSEQVPITIHFLHWWESLFVWVGYILLPLFLIVVGIWLLNKKII